MLLISDIYYARHYRKKASSLFLLHYSYKKSQEKLMLLDTQVVGMTLSDSAVATIRCRFNMDNEKKLKVTAGDELSDLFD